MREPVWTWLGSDKLAKGPLQEEAGDGHQIPGGCRRSHVCLLSAIKPRRLIKKKESQTQFLLPTLMMGNPIYLHYKVTVSRGLSELAIFSHSSL